MGSCASVEEGGVADWAMDKEGQDGKQAVQWGGRDVKYEMVEFHYTVLWLLICL